MAGEDNVAPALRARTIEPAHFFPPWRGRGRFREQFGADWVPAAGK
jgi:hypothetical protein